MLKKAVGHIIRGDKLKVALPEADFLIRNEKDVGDSNYGTFEYDPQDQFAKFIREEVKEAKDIYLLRKAFEAAYESGGLGATHDLYNRIKSGWCSQCDTYVLTLDGKECMACGRTLTADEVGRTIKVATLTPAQKKDYK